MTDTLDLATDAGADALIDLAMPARIAANTAAETGAVSATAPDLTLDAAQPAPAQTTPPPPTARQQRWRLFLGDSEMAIDA